MRHGAKQLELEINEGGFVSLRDLAEVGEPVFGRVSIEGFLNFIEVSNRAKPRYELVSGSDGDWLVRATGKHTIEGVEKVAKPEGGGRKVSGRGKAGGKGGSEKKIDEEEFCQKFRLDKIAKSRLAELPQATRQLAMQKFKPEPQVPASDFPKVFVAFCKRFRTTQPPNGVAGAGAAGPGKGKPGGSEAASRKGGKGDKGSFADDCDHREDGPRHGARRSPVAPLPPVTSLTRCGAGGGGLLPSRIEWEDDAEITLGMDAIAYEQLGGEGRSWGRVCLGGSFL